LGQLSFQPLRETLEFAAPIIVAHMRPHALDHVRFLVQWAQHRRGAPALPPLGRLRFLGYRVVAIKKLTAPALFHAFSLFVQWSTAATKPVGEGGATEGRYRGVARRASAWSALPLASSAPFVDARCRVFNPPRTTR